MPKQPESNDLEFNLEPGVVPKSFPAVEGKKSAARKQTAKVSTGAGEPQVISYRHADRRRNNPQVGLVNENTDPGQPQTSWRYDPHIDPVLAFDTAKGELISGGKSKIAMWSLDMDYDDRSLLPGQVFFPMAGKDGGWKKLKKVIRAELNEELLDRFHGTVSLPFEAGENRKVAVKIVDDRGIESLKVISLEDKP